MTKIQKSIKILGIETSCDETAAAIITAKIKNKKVKIRNSEPRLKIKILSNVVASQIDLHRKYGGVYPELASRAHLENILPVISAALDQARIKIVDLDAIAVTVGPGLIGSLLIGTETARTLAWAFSKLLIGINHLEGHIFANFVGENSKYQQLTINNQLFPILNLIVSGGHTSLILMKDFGKYQTIGQTRDDAAGEAFDKVAQLIGLPYPGGPSIEAATLKKIKNQKSKIKIRIQNLKLPRPMIDSEDFDFSFSGLKTAVLKLTKELGPKLVNKYQAEIAAEFQKAVTEVLVSKTIAAAKKYRVKTIMLSGGVAANSQLRRDFESIIHNSKFMIHFLAPAKKLSTDNAAMIAVAGLFHFLKKEISNPFQIQASSNLKLS